MGGISINGADAERATRSIEQALEHARVHVCVLFSMCEGSGPLL